MISLSILRIRCSSRFCIVSEASRSLPIASFVEFPPPLFPEGVGAAAFGFERPKRFIATRPATNTNNAASFCCVPLDISTVHGLFRRVAPHAPPTPPPAVSTFNPHMFETSQCRRTVIYWHLMWQYCPAVDPAPAADKGYNAGNHSKISDSASEFRLRR